VGDAVADEDALERLLLESEEARQPTVERERPNLQTSDGTKATFTVRGVHKAGVERLVDGVVIAQAAVGQSVPAAAQRPQIVKGEPGARRDSTSLHALRYERPGGKKPVAGRSRRRGLIPESDCFRVAVRQAISD
jgi:hypothetical protein